MREAGRAQLAAVGLVGAVRHEIDAELAFGRLDRRIDLAGRHFVAFGVELEVVDERLHRGLHLGALGRRDLAVVGVDGAPARIDAEQLAALLYHMRALAHFLDAHEIAVVAIAVLADGDFKLHLVIAFIGLRAAQIPGDAGRAQHHAREAPRLRVRKFDYADVDVALHENAVAGEQALDVVEARLERVAERGDVVDQLLRQVLVDAAGTEIGGVHTRAAGALVEHAELFALLKTPQRRRQRADVQRLRRHVEDVRHDAPDLAIQHADELRAARHAHAEQAFDRQRIGVLLVHRRAIIEPVEIGHVLQIRARLHQLLGAAMQQADMRIDALDHFAVQLQHEAQHAVRGRVLWTEVDREIAEVAGGVHGVFAFSSPGNALVGPSQGLRKSNLRNSWFNVTGSLRTRFSSSS